MDLSTLHSIVTHHEEIPSWAPNCLCTAIFSGEWNKKNTELGDEKKRVLLALSIAQNVLMHATADVTYMNLLRNIGEAKLRDTLGNMVKEKDKYVAYQASVCLASCLKQKVFPVNVEWFEDFIATLLIGATNTTSNSHQVHEVDVLKNIFSRTSDDKPSSTPTTNAQDAGYLCVQKTCCQALSKHWASLVTTFLDIKQGSSNIILYSFLSLWKKLLKFTWKLHDFSGNCYGIFLDKTLSLIEVISTDKVTACLTPISYIKILDILNAGLPYASLIAIQKDLNTTSFTRLSQKVVEHVDCLIKGLPRRCGTVGFGGPVLPPCNACLKGATGSKVFPVCDKQTLDNRAVRRLVLLILKACIISGNFSVQEDQGKWESIIRAVDHVKQCALSGSSGSSSSVHWLLYVLADQDDDLTEAMLCLLHLHVVLRESAVAQSGEVDNPHVVFLHFLHTISHDHKVLLDFLTSPETCFLLYFTRYLRFCLSSWDDLYSCSQQFEISHVLSRNYEYETSIHTPSKGSTCSTSLPDANKETTICSLPLIESETETALGDEIGSACNVLKIEKNCQKRSIYYNKDSQRSHDNDKNDVNAKHDVELKVNMFNNSDICLESDCAGEPAAKALKIEHQSGSEKVNHVEIESPAGTKQNTCIVYQDSLKTCKQTKNNPKYSKKDGGIGAPDPTLNQSESYKSATPRTICYASCPMSIKLTEYSDSEGSNTASDSSNSNDEEPADNESDILSRLKSTEDGDVDLWPVNSVLDDMMAVFIRTRMAIERLEEKNLFPYNASLLIVLLEKCEKFYENDT